MENPEIWNPEMDPEPENGTGSGTGTGTTTGVNWETLKPISR